MTRLECKTATVLAPYFIFEILSTDIFILLPTGSIRQCEIQLGVKIVDLLLLEANTPVGCAQYRLSLKVC